MIGAAAADVAGHGEVDVAVGRLGFVLEQRATRRHDLARLAVAALRHVERDPGGLHRIRDLVGFAPSIVVTSAPSSVDIGVTHERARLAVEVHGAGAALGDAAAELGAGQSPHVAQVPEQRHRRVAVILDGGSVHGQLGHGSPRNLQRCTREFGSAATQRHWKSDVASPKRQPRKGARCLDLWAQGPTRLAAAR